jgi:hypothetical protein
MERRGAQESTDTIDDMRKERRSKRRMIKEEESQKTCEIDDDTQLVSSFADVHMKMLLETPPSKTIYYHPGKTANTLLYPFVNRDCPYIKRDLAVGPNGGTKDKKVIEEVRQKLIEFSTRAPFRAHPTFPDVKIYVFKCYTTDRVISGLMELVPKQGLPPTRETDLYLSFRVLNGEAESMTCITRPKKLRVGDELHAKPGIGFCINNQSRIEPCLLYFRIRKVEIEEVEI